MQVFTLAAAAFASLLGFHSGAASSTVPTNPTHVVANLACIGTAANAREASIDSAVAAYTSSVNSDYTTRASAIASAYALTTGNDSVRTGIQIAWSNFTSAQKNAGSSFKAARTAAWTNFTTAAHACGGAQSMLSDSSESSSDSVGGN